MTSPGGMAAPLLESAVDLIRRSQHVVVATHISPDPDAIGCLLGAGLLLADLGKPAVLVCDDPIPRALRFLPGSAAITDGLPPEQEFDLLWALDASDTERLGKVVQPLLARGGAILNLDHHITNLNFGSVNVVNPKWAATAEGLAALIDALGAAITPDIAACLLAGLVGDTRSFSTPSTTPASLLLAARLVEAGADIATITELAFQRRTFDALKMWGLGLTHAVLEDGVIWTAVPLSERQVRSLQDANSSGLSNLLISVEEASIAAVFTEQPNQSIDASFRARPGYDVAQAALALGGGGHSLAAGAQMAGPLEEAVSRAVGLLKREAQRVQGATE